MLSTGVQSRPPASDFDGQRRRLLAALAATFGTAPCRAWAQPAEKVRAIGYLTLSEKPSLRDEVFLQSMRELGWIEGKNLRVEVRRAGGDTGRLAAMAQELVKLNVDLIVAVTTTSVAAARDATRTIPIVSISADPVANGFVASLRRPGGNITGLSSIGPALSGKRLELLREINPKIARVAFLAYGPDPAHKIFIAQMEEAGRALGVRIQPFIVSGVEEIEAAFAAMKVALAEAVVVQPLFINTLGLGPRIAGLANMQRLLSISDGDVFADVGGLLLFGPDPVTLYRRMAYYTDRVLKGAKPAELPVEQPSSFLVSVNLKTAKQLGVKIPQSILVRANRVIE